MSRQDHCDSHDRCCQGPESRAGEQADASPGDDPNAARTSTDGDQETIVCRKTGKVMSWDEADCPNKGKTCGYRGECQIPFLAEERNESS